MVNPYQPAEPLIQIFMDGYYGAAAPKMNAYLKYLEERIDRQADWMMVHTAPHNLKYLDLDFFVTARSSLMKPNRSSSRAVWKRCTFSGNGRWWMAPCSISGPGWSEN